VDESSLRLLLARLKWPSDLVRERACAGIAQLLLDPSTATGTLEALLAWTRAQRLESVAALGIIPFLHAKIVSNSYDLPPLPNVEEAVRAPSLLSWIFLEELYDLDLQPPSEWGHAGRSPSDHVVDEFFGRYVSNFLPPIYRTFGEYIQQHEQVPFLQQWGYEWEQIVGQLDIPLSPDILHFMGRPEDEHFRGVSFRMSEVYRSSFLRALQWAIDDAGVPLDTGRFFASKMCPVDLGLWRVKPSQKPSWWPTAKADARAIDTVPAQIWSRLQALWRERRLFETSHTIACAEGMAFQNDMAYDLEIRGAFQKSFGGTRPALDDIVTWYAGSASCNYEPQDKRRLRFEGRLRGGLGEQVFPDWAVVPAAVRVWPEVINRWQSWRHQRGTWLPNPKLFDDVLTFRCTDDALEAYVKGEPVGRWTDWTDQLQEKMEANLPPATGTCLMVRTDYLREFAKLTGSRFCWFCRLTGYFREHGYGEFKTFEAHRVFGASSIITF